MATKTNKQESTESIAVLVIDSELEANEFIKKISELQKQKTQNKIDTDLKIAELQEKLANTVELIDKEIKSLTIALKNFSDSNKEVLFKNSKTLSLPCGDLLYRKNKDLVDTKNSKKTVESILKKNNMFEFSEKVKAKFSKVFLRMKLELDKEAVHANSVKAKEVTGIKITEGVERFTIKPYETEIEIEAPL